MKSFVIKKLKLLSKSFFYPLIVNKDTIFNYINLDELIFYIYKLTINENSKNQLILISQNINLNRLIGRPNEKNNFLNKFFLTIKKFLAFFF